VKTGRCLLALPLTGLLFERRYCVCFCVARDAREEFALSAKRELLTRVAGYHPITPLKWRANVI